MTPRERLLTALCRGVPDRLPVTVHQWQPSHLARYMGGMSALEAFRTLGMDAAIAVFDQLNLPQAEATWRECVVTSTRPDGTARLYRTVATPEGTLTEVLERDAHTTWTVEPLCKAPEDVRLVARYLPVPRLDVDGVRRLRDEIGDAGILRGTLCGPQAGPWQHACCLFGIERMIFATFDDPGWVHELLRVLTDKKLAFIEHSLPRAPFDLIETGGGAASSTVISPKIFQEFCLPYDRELHDALHAVGHRVVYHTCGGMMPLLDLIVATGADASETLSPPSMGGDADHAEIKRRIGDKVALIGGMDQQLLTHGTPAQIRAEVRRLFEALGQGGGYIMAPSDHFFDVPVEHLRAFAEAAKECVYG